MRHAGLALRGGGGAGGDRGGRGADWGGGDGAGKGVAIGKEGGGCDTSDGIAGGTRGTGGGGEGGHRFFLVSAASRRCCPGKGAIRSLQDRHTCVPGAESCRRAKVTSELRMGCWSTSGEQPAPCKFCGQHVQARATCGTPHRPAASTAAQSRRWRRSQWSALTSTEPDGQGSASPPSLSKRREHESAFGGARAHVLADANIPPDVEALAQRHRNLWNVGPTLAGNEGIAERAADRQALVTHTLDRLAGCSQVKPIAWSNAHGLLQGGSAGSVWLD
eukprot:scaffold266576_cov27-Tisochrysis_lutea.AAC.1